MSSHTLSRKEFESIVIFTKDDDQITITVQSIARGKVELNFEVPEGVDIWREELLEDEGL